MPLRRAVPLQFSPAGASDALDATNVRAGPMAALTNLIPDPTTKNVWVCRPAMVLLANMNGQQGPFSSGFSSGFQQPFGSGSVQALITAQIVVGTRLYGMVSSNLYGATDIPFSYNIATGTFDTISGVTASNTPASPPATGPWTPPTMALVGPYILVTHPGFDFAAGNAFGVINISNPSAPTWEATNCVASSGPPPTFALPALPSYVANFNGRAYFLLNPPGQQPSAFFTDINNPFSATGVGPTGTAVPALTFGDNTPLTCLGALGLYNQLGGIVQGLMVFKSDADIYQITGDAALGTLAVNALNVATGTLCPLAIASTPKGLAFLAPDGVRIINYFGQVGDPIGVDGDGINVPFLNVSQPTRAVMACNQNVLRITIQNGSAPGAPVQEWWCDFNRKERWSGPHTSVMSQISGYQQTFIGAPIAVQAAIFQSDVQPSPASSYVENGTQLTWTWQTCMLPDPKLMAYFSCSEATLNMALSAMQNVNVAALDQDGQVLGSVQVTGPGTESFWGEFNWGSATWGAQSSALFPRPLEWSAPIVARRMQLQATGQSSMQFRIGDLFLRYQVLGYMAVYPAA